MATTKATTLAHTLGGISSDISTAEINRLDGVTGDLQTQLDAKLATTTASSTYAPKASPVFTGNVTAPDVLSTNLKHASSSSNNIVLASNGSISRSKRIAFQIKAGGSQTIGHSAWPPTVVTGGIEFENHYGSSNLASHVFTVPVAGPYMVGCTIAADWGSSGPRDIDDSRIFLNITPSGGSAAYEALSGEFRSNPTDDITYLSGSKLREFGVGDQFSFGYYFAEGGATATIGGTSNYWAFLIF